MYPDKLDVISLGDSKQAALYFDRVVIVDPIQQMRVMGLPAQLKWMSMPVQSCCHRVTGIRIRPVTTI
jgi:hypothetical protein